MTVFPFPPDFPGLSVPFSVVGFDWDSGAPDGELLVLPRGCGAPAFDGPVFTPDAAFDDDRLLIRVLLYDTDETLAMQLALAAACGVPQVFGPLTTANSAAVLTD